MSAGHTVAVDLRALVPETTGIGVYSRELLLALAARGGAWRYVGMAHREPAAIAALKERGVEIDPRWAPLGAVWQQWTLPRQLSRGGFDLLFSPVFTLPWRCPIPAVVTVPDLTVYRYPELHTRKVRWSITTLLPRSLRQAARVIAISEATAADLAERFPGCAHKVRVTHLGVDPRFRPGAADAVARVRERFGAPQGYVLFVGTVEPRKNLGRLLAAWERVKRADPGFPPLLVAGGEGWHSGELFAEIERLAPLGARYLGRVDDAELPALYQGAAAFAYPSLYEGFGLPVAEAMASGVPVLTSNHSSLHEVAGGAALEVDPESVAAIADGLRRLVADRALARDLAARGVERAARFTWQRAAEETEAVFAEALDEARATPRGRRAAIH